MVKFSTLYGTALSGTLKASGPIQVQLANPKAWCAVNWYRGPPYRGCPNPGPGAYYFATDESTEFDLASFQLNFTGSNAQLPSGDWMFYLVNWNPAEVEVSITSPLTASVY